MLTKLLTFGKYNDTRHQLPRGRSAWVSAALNRKAKHVSVPVDHSTLSFIIDKIVFLRHNPKMIMISLSVKCAYTGRICSMKKGLSRILVLLVFALVLVGWRSGREYIGYK